PGRRGVHARDAAVDELELNARMAVPQQHVEDPGKAVGRLGGAERRVIAEDEYAVSPGRLGGDEGGRERFRRDHLVREPVAEAAGGDTGGASRQPDTAA